MAKDHRLSMRIPAALREALDRLALADRRSLASYVEQVLEEHVATRPSGSRTAKPHPKPGRHTM